MEYIHHVSKKTVATCIVVAFLAVACAFLLSSCGQQRSSSDDTTITVGASPTPHAEILNNIKDDLAAQGYTLNVVEYNDYVTPNEALANGDIDANYFQHKPYLDNYNSEKGTNLVSVGSVHFEPMAIYAGNSSDIANVPEGAKIAVPSDATNEARALDLLAEQGVITLAEGAGLSATTNDIVANPHNVDIIEAEAASLPRELEDCDFAVIDRNYAISAQLSNDLIVASEDENSDAASTYANIVAVRDGDQDSPKIKALISALQSEKTKDFINSTYDGAIIPLFENA